MLLCLGTLAFALFFLGDYNDWKWGVRALRFCFPAGFILLTAVTVLQAAQGGTSLPLMIRGLFFVGGAGFFALLVYTLFLALPAAASYASPGERRPVQRGGVYALCRHPGVLWFVFLYLCLWPAAGLPASAVAVYSALDLLLVTFEDVWVFPDRLEGYETYKRETPFLLPTAHSFRACCKTK